MKKLLNQTKQKKGDIMQKLLNQTKKLLLFLSICIGSLTFTFTTQAQNTDDPTGLFSGCKDTSKSVDKSLRDVVINTVKATGLFLELGKMRGGPNFLGIRVHIIDRKCALVMVRPLDVFSEQVTEFNSLLKGYGGALDPVGIHSRHVYSGVWNYINVNPRTTDRDFCDIGEKRKECSSLLAQLLKPKHSLEQTFHSQTWNQDFLGGITDIRRTGKAIWYPSLSWFVVHRWYIVTHKSNPDSVYVFAIDRKS